MSLKVYLYEIWPVIGRLRLYHSPICWRNLWTFTSLIPNLLCWRHTSAEWRHNCTISHWILQSLSLGLLSSPWRSANTSQQKAPGPVRCWKGSLRLLFLCFTTPNWFLSPVGKYGTRGKIDGWKNESQWMNGPVISRSNKPEGLIANIPHFGVNYGTQIDWGEY